MSSDNANVPLPPEGEGVNAASSSGIPVIHEEPTGQVPVDAPPPPPNGAPVDVPPPPSGAPVDVPLGGAPGTTPIDKVASLLAAPDGPPVIFQGSSLANGINKCPSCGSSDIQFNMSTGLLHCNFCRKEFAEESDGIDGDISKLNGMHMGTGVSDIAYDASDFVTLKCTACGSEVVVDTNSAPQARCHWCRNMLSLNQQVPNGAVPDAVMPFRLNKEQARGLIEKFVGSRRFFAHPKFKAEFSTENIMGCFLPYMVIDVNAHAEFRGEGEHEVRRYTVGSGNNKQTKYDADSYGVARVFDVYIDDLTVEASMDKLNQTTAVNSNNVINAILPYPLKETVRFNANYLQGFTSEKRNVNRDQVSDLVLAQVRDVARWNAWQNAQFYDRGIRWDVEDLDVKGELWKTVYLPVWLYSYLQVKSDGSKFLHYVAVNACTGETMGSVPIHKPKLVFISVIVEIFGIALAILLFYVLLFTGY